MSSWAVEHGWPVTVSMGVVTCIDPPDSLEHLLQRADELMYAAKAAGKNGLQKETFTARSRTAGAATLTSPAR